MSSRSGSSRVLLAACALVVGLSALVGFRLFPEPVLGIANNADFSRLLCPAGLHYPPGLEWPEQYFYCINRNFEYGPVPDDCAVYVTSETLLVRAALFLGRDVAGNRETFDIRLLGLVHCVVYVAAFLLFVLAARSWRGSTRALLIYLLVLVYADIGYVVYFNSFYCEPATLLFFLGTSGLFLLLASMPRDPERRSAGRTAVAALVLLGLLASCALFVASKPQNYIMVATCVPLCAYLVLARREWPLKIVAAAGVLLLPLLSFLLFQRVDPGVSRMQLFDIVFLDVVGHSPDPEGDLRELGLPEKYQALLGISAWEKDSPYRDPGFLEKYEEFEQVTYGSVARLYLKHPGRLIDDLRRSARQVLNTRLRGKFGHYEPSAGKPGGAQSSAFALWSQFRESVFPRRLWFLSLFALANLAVIVVKLWRIDRTGFDRGVTALHAWVLATGALAFVTVTAGGGSFAPRHMFLVNVAFDGCCIVLAMYGVGWMASRGGEAKRV